MRGSVLGLAAGDPAQCILVDVHPQGGFELRNILTEQIVRHGLTQRVAVALRFGGRRIERRHVDFGHAEHDALAGALPGSDARRVLGSLEHGVDAGDGERPRCIAALETPQRLDLEAGLPGKLGKRHAGLELVEQLRGFGGEPLRDLLVAPACLDLRFDFVETAITGRRDPGDVVPDEAATRQRQRFVVDADVRAECRGDDVGTGGQVFDRRSVGRPAGAIRLEIACNELVLLRDLVEVRPRRAVVLDLIAKIDQLRAGTVDRNLLFDGGRDVLVCARVSPLDLDDVRQNGPEPSGNRRADAAVRNREGRIGHRTVEQLVLGDEAEIEILWFQTALLCEIRKGGTLGQAVRRGTGLVRIREYDLFDPAFLRSAVTFPMLLVLLPNVFFGDFDIPSELLGRERQDRDLTVLGRAELGFVLLIIFRESFRRGRRDVAGPGAVEPDIFDGALLVLKTIDGVRQRFRRSEAAAHRIDDLAAKLDASLI